MSDAPIDPETLRREESNMELIKEGLGSSICNKNGVTYAFETVFEPNESQIGHFINL